MLSPSALRLPFLRGLTVTETRAVATSVETLEVRDPVLSVKVTTRLYWTVTFGERYPGSSLWGSHWQVVSGENLVLHFSLPRGSYNMRSASLVQIFECE